MSITTSGGVPDADLYVREASLPTTSTYACRPYTSGNNESCTLSAAAATTYYVMVRGYVRSASRGGRRRLPRLTM